MRLLCYALHDDPSAIVAASPQRDWMDEFSGRHPYRCLPLAIANAHGWDVLCPVAVDIAWNGGTAVDDLTVSAAEALPGGRQLRDFCRSHFSHGVVTFHLDYVFRTDPGWDLIGTGSFNRPKDGIYPLTGVMEADWLPYPFTMNWQMLRPGRVRFEKNEPFCCIFPVRKQALSHCVPDIRRLSDDPELERQHTSFRLARDGFQARIEAGDAETLRQPWQRHYFLGRHPDGTRIYDHVNRLRLPEPIDRRGAAPPATRAAALIASVSTADNIAGRSLIDREGRLEDGKGVADMRTPDDAASCEVLMIEDFLDTRACAALCRAFAALADKVVRDDAMDPFWNSRTLPLDVVLAAIPLAGRIMMEAQHRALREIAAFYRLSQPIYSDLLQMVHWQDGMFMPPHADRANPDGSPHPAPHRDFAGIVYLNDGYTGGELYFTALGRLVRPRRGLFVGFTAGFRHEHAMLRLQAGGPRITMPSFFTFDRARADKLLHPRNNSVDFAGLAGALYGHAASRIFQTQAE